MAIAGYAPALLLTLAAASAPIVYAQESDTLARESHLYDPFQVSLGGAMLNLNTDVQVNSSDGVLGSELNVEDDLGASRWLFEPAVTFRWRPGRWHELELGYLLVRRSSSRELARTILFADTSFSAGLRLKAATKTDQASLAYRFAFHAGDRSQFGAGLGLGVLIIREELTAEGVAVFGGATPTASYSADKGVYGPTATIGMFGRFYLGQHIETHTELRAIRVSISNFTATVVEGALSLRYFANHLFGMELGYTLGSYAVSLEEDASRTRFLGTTITGKFDYTVHAIRASFILAF